MAQRFAQGHRARPIFTLGCLPLAQFYFHYNSLALILPFQEPATPVKPAFPVLAVVFKADIELPYLIVQLPECESFYLSNSSSLP